jgi:acetyl esterase/lipase
VSDGRPVRASYPTVDGTELPIDVFRPSAQPDGAAVVFFHGGGLTRSAPDYFHPECAYLSSRGIVAASAGYRLLPHQARSAADCIADAQAAIAWMRTGAGSEIDRVAACGNSAGGLLAGAAAFEPPPAELGASCRPDAVVLLNAVIDTGWPEKVAAGGGACPPMLILHARRDTMAPIGRARRLAEELLAGGHSVEVAEFDGAHTFFRPYATNGSAGFIGVLQRLDRFLTDLGYLAHDELATERIDALGGAMLADVLARRAKRRRPPGDG